MTLTIAHITPFVALLAGILILIVPRLLSFIVAIYLIIRGTDRPQRHSPLHPVTGKPFAARKFPGLRRHRRP
jgi:Protein of unknown function (DUF3096)